MGVGSRPTTSDERPTNHDQRPTTNVQRPTLPPGRASPTQQSAFPDSSRRPVCLQCILVYPSCNEETQMQIAQPSLATTRYAKCIEVSKRIRWDIDRDVIRGRSFDFAKKFLPDGLSQVDRLHVPERRRAPPALADPGPHLRQHVRAGRALHRRQDARAEPRPLARRPGRAGSAGALYRRGDSSTRSCSAASRR